MPSDKCAASWGSEDAEMRMITARFVRVLPKYTDSLCTHYMFTLQVLSALWADCSRPSRAWLSSTAPSNPQSRQREL